MTFYWLIDTIVDFTFTWLRGLSIVICAIQEFCKKNIFIVFISALSGYISVQLLLFLLIGGLAMLIRAIIWNMEAILINIILELALWVPSKVYNCGWADKSTGCLCSAECVFESRSSHSVSLSKTLNYHCLVLWMWRKAVCPVNARKRTKCTYQKEKGFALVFLVWSTAYCATSPFKSLQETDQMLWWSAEDDESILIETLSCQPLLLFRTTTTQKRLTHYHEPHPMVLPPCKVLDPTNKPVWI